MVPKINGICADSFDYEVLFGGLSLISTKDAVEVIVA
jgi:hypothetical protein